MNRISAEGETQNALIENHARFIAVYPLLQRAAQVGLGRCRGGVAYPGGPQRPGASG
jgi:hypothetical protein